MTSISNDFCFFIALDENGDILLEVISEFKEECIDDASEALYAVCNGYLNKEIVKHLNSQIKHHPEKKPQILKLIKKFNSLNSVRDAPPLIDSLQVIHE